MKPILLIAIGGAAGSVARYLLSLFVMKQMTLAFPLGTMLVNLSGCFMIGLIYGLSSRYAWITEEWRLLLATGICGGYTTFSSFSYESIALIREGDYAHFFGYVSGSVILGLLATAGGFWLTR
ncbi:MAG TPA: fluoride efflux transporter CrcB [Puia sp.]|jgi:CrcB protein|nr:fluoride efflux transporter CrcB [Puia sp.]